MKLLLLSVLIISEMVFCGAFAILGIDITGHVFPFVGVGFALKDENFVASFGVTYDFGNSVWIFENSLGYFHEFESVKLGLNFTTMIADEKILYLIGPEMGYSFALDFGRIDLEGSAMMTLPFGAVRETKGPVPVIKMLWRSE